MRKFVLNFLDQNGGCKFSELCYASRRHCSYDELISTVNLLIFEKEIIEIKYSLKNQHSEKIGFLLPKNTFVQLRGI